MRWSGLHNLIILCTRNWVLSIIQPEVRVSINVHVFGVRPVVDSLVEVGSLLAACSAGLLVTHTQHHKEGRWKHSNRFLRFTYRNYFSNLFVFILWLWNSVTMKQFVSPCLSNNNHSWFCFIVCAYHVRRLSFGNSCCCINVRLTQDSIVVEMYQSWRQFLALCVWFSCVLYVLARSSKITQKIAKYFSDANCHRLLHSCFQPVCWF